MSFDKKFVAILSSHNEVPPFNSDARGIAEFTVTTAVFPDGSVGNVSIEWSVNATNIQGVTAGYIHSGKQGENGPTVGTLFKNESPTNEVSEKGHGSQYGKDLDDIVTAMNNGERYVNVTTEQNPHGEIRGQILSSSGGQ